MICCTNFRPPVLQVIYTETLSNPTLVVADLPILAELAHSKARGWVGRRPAHITQALRLVPPPT